ncbi:DUF485 domain-containing protein [Aeromicrobium sp. CnD17-E]|uniref:DUF485 domain-containing protein n=1 Tax=Aeromicrobium sp. CnD17-E TaxID=2954487 RepID=UPI002097B04C|nr:DUF485 domain-containing protein [Aeromicrobium sp. CnD17-E]MCO7239626.1 DUF485 domain-containing protein [Aeromicrobium sp. CnD17-E]
MAEKLTPEVHAAYERIHDSEEFTQLRSNYLRFVVPMTVGFMLWYLLYVVCSNWAPGLMGTQVFGTINVALLFGLLQFVTTFGIAWVYARYSARAMDPIAAGLLDDFEREVGR